MLFRSVLGGHVKQAGSVVEPSRLRFDFTHYTAMDRDELAEVERLMNQEILANRVVHTDVMDLDQALLQRLSRLSRNDATHLRVHLLELDQIANRGIWLRGNRLCDGPLRPRHLDLFDHLSRPKHPHRP